MREHVERALRQRSVEIGNKRRERRCLTFRFSTVETVSGG